LPLLTAQSSGVLSLVPPQKLTVKRGSVAEAKLTFALQPGYHTNSNNPSEDYLIPLRLTWDKGVLEGAEITYPKAHLEKYEFSPTPLSVFTGNFDIQTKFKVPAGAVDGPNVMSGKLRYQACNKTSCLAPKTIEVKLPVIVY
jgi:cytochrome c biogenesis DsbD-like protein